MRESIDILNLFLILVSSGLIILNRKNMTMLFFFIFNFASILVFYLQYYLGFFERFSGRSLLPGTVELTIERVSLYIGSLVIIHYITNYKIVERIYKSDRGLKFYLLCLLSLLFASPLFFLGEGKGDFWTVALLMVPVLISYRLVKSDANLVFKFFFVIVVLGLLMLKSSKGIFLNYLVGFLVVSIQKYNFNSKLIFLGLILSFFIGYLFDLNYKKEYLSGNSFSYVFEREYSVEVFMKVEEVDNYYKYILLEFYDVIPSALLSQFGIVKYGNSRVLFNDFNIDYAGDTAGYYIGSLTYVGLINSYLGKLIYLFCISMLLRYFVIFFNKSYVIGLIVFNMDFLFNGNFSYFLILFFIPVLVIKLLNLLMQPFYNE